MSLAIGASFHHISTCAHLALIAKSFCIMRAFISSQSTLFMIDALKTCHVQIVIIECGNPFVVEVAVAAGLLIFKGTAHGQANIQTMVNMQVF